MRFRILAIAFALIAVVAVPASVQALPISEVREASKIMLKTKLAPLLTTRTTGNAPFRVYRCDHTKCRFIVNGTIRCNGIIHVVPASPSMFSIWISRMKCR